MLRSQKERMKSFIDELVQLVKSKYKNFSELTVILPSKRACLYFSRALINTGLKNTWLPEVITLTDFIEKFYPGKISDQITLISELYKTVTKLEVKDIESFESFYSWGSVLLSDYNRVDAYLIDSVDLYKNLRAVEEIQRWSFNSDELSENQKSFNDFWMMQGSIYLEFKKQLEKNDLAYSGMVTRYVAENASDLFKPLNNKAFVIAGFNAISKAEQLIIDELSKVAQLYYKPDIDQFFVSGNREAGHFYRQLKKKYRWDGLSEIADVFSKTKKQFNIISASQNSTMAQVVGQLLSEKSDFGNTAVVLADENMLNPLLQNIPKNVKALNVTMGYKLKQTPVYDLFLALTAIQDRISKNGKTIYYKDLIRFINHPYLINLLGVSFVQDIKQTINNNNLVYCNATHFKSIFSGLDLQFNLEEFLFSKWNNIPSDPTNQLLKLTEVLSNLFNTKENTLELEYLFHFKKAILQMQNHLDEYQIEVELKGYKMLFSEILRSFSITFKGEPLVGLQIMGLLETRMLDFEDVIIVSANEGKLPKGRSTHSFIPWDLKHYFEMPGIKEQDALYAYYFYRMINRAKNVHIIYTTDMGKDLKEAEPSRYLRQLEYYMNNNELPFDLKYSQAKPEINSDLPHANKIKRDKFYRGKLKEKLKKGISPTALSTYLTCPLNFYYKYILGLRESDEVDEEIGADVFGIIIHKTLEGLYKPFEGKSLDDKAFKSIVKDLKKELYEVVNTELKNHYIKTGVNQLNLQIIEKLLKMFISIDKKYAEEFTSEGKDYSIVELEKHLERNYDFEINGEQIKVKLRGFADRIDKVGNTTRVIDYKTGRVNGISNIEVDKLFTDANKSKALQLLLYRAMYDNFSQSEVITGIVGFRSINKYLNIFGLKKGEEINLKEKFLSGFEGLLNDMLNGEEYLEHNPKSKWCKFCTIN